MKLQRKLFVAAFVALFTLAAFAQPDDPQGPPMGGGGQGGPGMQGEHRMPPGVAGTITEIKDGIITVKTFHGDTAKVKVTAETKFRKDRAEAKLADFKVGDTVFVGGEKDKDGVWTAKMVGSRTGGPGGPGGQGMMGERPNMADMGKTFIMGEITKIDGTKLTIKRMDNVEQVIEVDDSTSFRAGRGQESITLADFKVGDHVGGRGALKNNVFVPTELRKMPARPGQGPGGHDGPGGPPPDGAQPPEGGVQQPPSGGQGPTV